MVKKLGGIGLALGVLLVGWAVSSFALSYPWNLIVLGVGAVLAIAGIAAILLPSKKAKATTYDITSHNQSGGITSGTVNLGNEGTKDGRPKR